MAARRGGVVRVTVLLVAALLAGCSSGEQKPDAVSPTSGLIRGLVIDTAIVPVPEATIVLDTGETAVAAADGSFEFRDVEPGTRMLDVSKPGYDSVRATTVVAAGVVPPVLKIQLTEAPELLAAAVPASYTGWIACEALVAMFLQPCDAGTGVFEEPDNRIFLPAPDRVPTAIHVEVVWKPQQNVGERLTQTIGSCDGGAYCEPFAGENFLCQNWGSSPLWCRIGTTGGTGNGHFCCAEGLSTQGHGRGTDVGVSVHLGADCSLCLDPVDPAMGLGVVFQQTVDVYLWSFYNFEPPEDWVFSRDGAPTVP